MRAFGGWVIIWLGLMPSVWATDQVFVAEAPTLSTSAVRFSWLNGGTWQATEADTKQLTAVAGTITEIYVKLSAAPGTSKSYAVLIRVAGANSSASCTVSDSSTSCGWTGAVAVTAGQSLNWQATPTGTPAAANATMYVIIRPTTEGKTLLSSNTGGVNISASATNYICPQAGCDPSATETNSEFVLPVAATVKNFYVELSGSPNNGAGTQTYTFRVRLCNPTCANTSITCAISEAATTCNDTSNSFTLAAGDLVDISSVNSAGTPTARKAFFGMDLTPTNAPGTFVYGSTDAGGTLTNNATAYDHAHGGFFGWGASEAATQQQTSPFITVAQYVQLSAAPGASKSYAFTLDEAASPTPLTVTISGASATTGSITSTADAHAAQSLLSQSEVPTGTPTAVTATIGYLGYNPTGQQGQEF